MEGRGFLTLGTNGSLDTRNGMSRGSREVDPTLEDHRDSINTKGKTK